MSALLLSLSAVSMGPLVDGENFISTGADSLLEGVAELDGQIQLIHEGTFLGTGAPVPVDAIVLGDLPGLEFAEPGTFPADIFMDSYYLHYDPVGQPIEPVVVDAWLESLWPFALIYTDTLLDTSDGVFGRSTISYPTGVVGRGLESDTIDVDILTSPPAYPVARTRFSWSETGAGLDGMRVVFLPGYPEPGTAVMLATGLLAGCAHRVNRR